ncbi:hypothetical protein [Hyphomicrobium sp.]|uniref:hypothetical protein n=1 Tax=Hyphomicrobium sp. TaxID=82 RepID=UPI002FE25B18
MPLPLMYRPVHLNSLGAKRKWSQAIGCSHFDRGATRAGDEMAGESVMLSEMQLKEARPASIRNNQFPNFVTLYRKIRFYPWCAGATVAMSFDLDRWADVLPGAPLLVVRARRAIIYFYYIPSSYLDAIG